MKLDKYLTESYHKIDFFSRWGYIGASNAVAVDNTVDSVVKRLRNDKALLSYFAIILMEEIGFNDIATKLTKLLDGKAKELK